MTDQKKEKQVIFRAPKPVTDAADHVVSMEVILGNNGKEPWKPSFPEHIK